MVLSALVRTKHAFLFTSVVALTFLLPSSVRADQTTITFTDTSESLTATATGRAKIVTLPILGPLCGTVPAGQTKVEGCIVRIDAPSGASFSSGNQVYLAAENSTVNSDAIVVVGHGSYVFVTFISDTVVSGQEQGLPPTCNQLKKLADVDTCTNISEAGSIHITWGTGSNMGTDTVNFQSDTPGFAPEPTSLVLLGSGLLAIAGFLRKRL